MKLRSQLLLAGTLTLLLPVVTWQYLIELSGVLSESGRQESQLHISAIETVLQHTADRAFLIYPDNDGRNLYAEYSSHPITLDGYQEDWSDLSQPEFKYRYSDNKSTAVTGSGAVLAEVGVRLAVTDSNLFLYFTVADNKVVYHDPGRGEISTGDRLELYVKNKSDPLRHYVLRVIAPGSFKALSVIRYDGELQGAIHDSSVVGYWEPMPNGYAVEVKLPRPVNGAKFGFSLIDIDDPVSNSDDAWIGTVDPQTVDLTGQIHYMVDSLNNYLISMVPKASRLRVFNKDGWLLADINRLKNLPEETGVIDPRTSGFMTALLYRFFNWAAKDHTVSENDVFTLVGPTRLNLTKEPGQRDGASGRYRTSGLIVNGLLRPLINSNGYVLLETADESVSAIINSTMVRLFVAFVVFTGVLILGLLFYAGWISGRVRRISQSTSSALRMDGSINPDIPGANASDEIGELSRNITDMLAKLSSYTDYLQHLASRLTHELRTPLAVVSTSLESMDKETMNNANREYLDRAESATGRLHGLIRSMSEATRLEQAVQTAEREAIDLLDWIRAVTPMYQGIYPDRNISLSTPEKLTEANILGSAELLQQMLDKLIANAVDFSVAESTIELRLDARTNSVDMSVFNQGDILPEIVSGKIFNPMMSHREQTDDEVHLGLGLHIVKLIADFHHGTASAKNDEAKRGVVITINLPLTP